MPPMPFRLASSWSMMPDEVVMTMTPNCTARDNVNAQVHRQLPARSAHHHRCCACGKKCLLIFMRQMQTPFSKRYGVLRSPESMILPSMHGWAAWPHWAPMLTARLNLIPDADSQERWQQCCCPATCERTSTCLNMYQERHGIMARP